MVVVGVAILHTDNQFNRVVNTANHHPNYVVLETVIVVFVFLVSLFSNEYGMSYQFWYYC